MEKILYKYVNVETFKKIWENKKIRFTQLSELNDPYENKVLEPNIDLRIDHFKILDISKRENISYINNMITIDTHECKMLYLKMQNEFNKRFGVLSLTSDPFNMLMWSHYGDSHKGVVIGIDISNEIFNNDSFWIKANNGKVRYSSKKPKITFKLNRNIEEVAKLGMMCTTFECESINIKDIFLNKSLVWKYEKEVRLVKDFSKDKGFVVNENIHLFDLPVNVIKKLYFGEKFESQDLIDDCKKQEIKCFTLKNDEKEYRFNIENL